ncbi:single-stranded DNA-binding protein [Candidatus Saccharibacteria bacterium]|nr:single-stranded DNA-binding protein [Candidatus Saccharibacteria bacterium]
MRGFSKAIITGNLTRDPELRTTTGGSNVCSFAVAVNRVYKGTDGENKEEVSYIDCVAWGKLGEMIANYAKKGSGVLVSGRLNQRSYEGKDGVKRSRTEIVVEDFNFVGQNPVGSRDGGSYSPSTSTSSSSSSDESSDMPSDIPEGEVDLSEIPF